jgi:hypothetical protein
VLQYGSSLLLLHSVVDHLSSQFSMKDLGSLHYFIQVAAVQPLLRLNSQSQTIRMTTSS